VEQEASLGRCCIITEKLSKVSYLHFSRKIQNYNKIEYLPELCNNANRLHKLPYITFKSWSVLLFPIERLDAVAKLVGVRKKRHLTSAQKEAASKRLVIARQAQKQAA
jgi:hypothetical protein